MRQRTATAARTATTLALLLALAGCGGDASEPAGPTAPPSPTAEESANADVSADLAALERELGVRVGVSALDTGTGQKVEHRADERFGFASTIKTFAVAELLRQIPPEGRDARVTWTAQDVEAAGHAPVTAEHVDNGLTLAELAEAAMRQSDNAATNLVLDAIGGPAELTAGLAELGDTTTVVTDREPELNDVVPGEPANTTTPAAFTATLATVLGPDVLSPEDRALLLDWMSGNATGDALVRGGAPDGWVVADKSGGAGPRRNDVAVVTPPGRDPILLTVLTEKDDPDAGYEDEVVARAAEVVLAAFE